MKTKLLLLYIAGLLAVCPMGGNLMAQTATQPDVLKNDTVSHKLIHRLGLDVRPSYVTPTNDFFDGDNMHQQRIRQALSVHLKYAFQFDKNSSLGRLYPHAYQGIGVSYNTFFCPSELGNPIAVYAFQGSRIAQLSPRLSFDYEWNFKSLEICSIKDEKGYIVAGRLSVSELLELGIDLEEFYMGVFRADFTTPNTVIWYSSVSINEPKPDFHKPNILFPCMKK